MPSVIPSPVYTIGQTVFVIGPTHIISGEITGLEFINPVSPSLTGFIMYEVCFNRETAIEARLDYKVTDIYTSHPDALTAYGARG